MCPKYIAQKLNIALKLYLDKNILPVAAKIFNTVLTKNFFI